MTISVECHCRITTEKAPFSESVSSLFFKSATDAAHKEQALICSSISVILRDTVGLSSKTSQAATAPSLPCTDES